MQSFARLLVDGLSLGILEATSRRWNLLPSDSGSDTSKLVVDQVWRWTVGIGIVPAAIAIIMRLTIPETPRYYAGIKNDLRKALKNTFMVYHASDKKKVSRPAQNAAPERQSSTDAGEAHWYEWYAGAWEYLTGAKKAWRTLGSISLLWALLDVCFYGLSMDLAKDLAVLFHDPAKDTSVCPDNPPWNPDWWNCNPLIYNALKANSKRFIWIASLPSVVGGVAAVLTINRFRRKHILAATFILISILLLVAGVSLIVTSNLKQSHVVTEVIYAILSFVFNLGPNTLIFVMAAEVFPTVYRGTFFGISAAMGKVGAVVIRVIITHVGETEVSLGVRLLVFMPLMLVSAVLSSYLPEVQLPTKQSPGETLDEERPHESDRPAVSNHGAPIGLHQQAQWLDGQPQSQRRSSESSFGEARPQPEPQTPGGRFRVFQRLENKALEDIAPNPASGRRI